MNKKPYAAPQLKQVRLEIKNAILATCHTSAVTLQPKIGDAPCDINPSCFLSN